MPCNLVSRSPSPPGTLDLSWGGKGTLSLTHLLFVSGVVAGPFSSGAGRPLWGELVLQGNVGVLLRRSGSCSVRSRHLLCGRRECMSVCASSLLVLTWVLFWLLCSLTDLGVLRFIYLRGCRKLASRSLY